MRPNSQDYPLALANYIHLVKEDDLGKAFQNQSGKIDRLFERITTSNAGYAYASGKWNVQILLQHILDTERIFAYRALAICRGEKQNLPGFEENVYAGASLTDNKNIEELKEEFRLHRRSIRMMFGGFDKKALNRHGIANGAPVTPLAIGFAIIGHFEHHLNIIHEKYLGK